MTLRRELSALEGVVDLKDNYRVGRPEMQLRIDRGAAKRIGAQDRVPIGGIVEHVLGRLAD